MKEEEGNKTDKEKNELSNMHNALRVTNREEIWTCDKKIKKNAKWDEPNVGLTVNLSFLSVQDEGKQEARKLAETVNTGGGQGYIWFPAWGSIHSLFDHSFVFSFLVTFLTPLLLFSGVNQEEDVLSNFHVRCERLLQLMLVSGQEKRQSSPSGLRRFLVRRKRQTGKKEDKIEK